MAIITQNYINKQLSYGAIICICIFVFSSLRYCIISCIFMYTHVYSCIHQCIPMSTHVHQCIIPVNGICTLIATFTLHKMPYYKSIHAYNLGTLVLCKLFWIYMCKTSQKVWYPHAKTPQLFVRHGQLNQNHTWK